jgi:hypothetical protein
LNACRRTRSTVSRTFCPIAGNLPRQPDLYSTLSKYSALPSHPFQRRAIPREDSFRCNASAATDRASKNGMVERSRLHLLCPRPEIILPHINPFSSFGWAINSRQRPWYSAPISETKPPGEQAQFSRYGIFLRAYYPRIEGFS